MIQFPYPTVSMRKDNESDQLGKKLTAVALRWPWLEILAEAWNLGWKIWRGLTDEGIYEVLEHDVTLELLDAKGKRALIRKRQKVHYLQNNIMAYQDQAWGDGQILAKYQCSPGVEVDRYESGRETQILISLREMKERGDVDVFNI